MLRFIDTCQNKVSADNVSTDISRDHISGSCIRLTCCRRVWVIRKPVRANPGLKVYRSRNIHCIQIFCLFILRVNSK